MKKTLLSLFVVAALIAFVTKKTSKAESNARSALTSALLAEDAAAIEQAVAAGKKALGSQVGVPEVPDEYAPVPSTARVLTPAEARRAMAPHFQRIEKTKFWKVGCDPTQLSAPLRAPGSIIACMVAVDRARLDGADKALPVAREAADFLIWAQQQAGAGCYPFPAAKNTSQERAMQVATRFLQRAEAAGKLNETVRNGWAFEDHGDGGLQFDNGECGVAMLDLYEHTNDQRYLDSALQAADWAITRPLCPNWNYNSFSVHLLAKAYAVTQNKKYLDAAVKKAVLGVIPGQLTDGTSAGRWMDPHNARPAYHYIMMSALAQLSAVLPTMDEHYPTVMKSLTLGLQSRNTELLSMGVMNKDKPIECLLLVQRLFATNPTFLETTQNPEALANLCRFTSEQARSGKLPLGPRGWGEMLEHLALAGH
jgi:hypothetical protein